MFTPYNKIKNKSDICDFNRDMVGGTRWAYSVSEIVWKTASEQQFSVQCNQSPRRMTRLVWGTTEDTESEMIMPTEDWVTESGLMNLMISDMTSQTQPALCYLSRLVQEEWWCEERLLGTLWLINTNQHSRMYCCHVRHVDSPHQKVNLKNERVSEKWKCSRKSAGN